jgi:hypothetical protein
MGFIASAVQRMLSTLVFFIAFFTGLHYTSWYVAGFIFFLGMVFVCFITLKIAGVD